MDSILDLTQMLTGEFGEVIEIQGGYGMRRRLECMGLKPGARIKKISSQFMRGPVTLSVCNTQIALGYGMAKKIMLRKV